MNSKQLKQLVKSLVKECVNEILAEKYIETKITESASPKSDCSVYVESKTESRPALRESIVEKLGLKEEDPVYSIFQDTAEHLPDPNDKNLKAPNESISERQMEKAGIMQKDWSRFL